MQLCSVVQTNCIAKFCCLFIFRPPWYSCASGDPSHLGQSDRLDALLRVPASVTKGSAHGCRELLRRCPIRNGDTWITHSVWDAQEPLIDTISAVGYPLSVSRLSTTQLHALQGPMVSLMLTRMHFSKGTRRPALPWWAWIRHAQHGSGCWQNHTSNSSSPNTRSTPRLADYCPWSFPIHGRRRFWHNGEYHNGYPAPGRHMDANCTGVFAPHFRFIEDTSKS